MGRRFTKLQVVSSTGEIVLTLNLDEFHANGWHSTELSNEVLVAYQEAKEREALKKKQP